MHLHIKNKKITTVFYALLGVFVVLLIAMSLFGKYKAHPFLVLIAGIAFFVLGVALLFLTLKQKEGGMLKKFLVLTGASAVGLFVCAVLHNVVYGLFIRWFGPDFWNKRGSGGGDEAFFFIMAIIVCPILFLTGSVGSIILFIKNKK